ncbi:uncharacterized protein LOC114051117 [Vombatus ursinus]|uniref:uncharacterized protein LOC114051117 n=1 Tax=Vombatus ursinus TaxID=29139 RepID=UPI000FFDB3D2|nr:uncharacterized protein LOC114051117 [Vombatus ursinus]XP_027729092.1 uncharacterized protein LOC114051117 [Vombatus ursinus]XP_027729093.1 uncharacterized protein LOC114051117 [Vombatus ursinus]
MAYYFLLRIAKAFWLLTVLNALENSEFAKFECQKEVSACRNDQVEIICNSTMDFDGIDLYFRKDKKDKDKLLFSMTTVGESPLQHGMHLKFKNQEVTLVIQNIQFSHHGIYRWHLSGHGSSNKFTTLTVSEPPMISKENGLLICRATRVKAGRRIIWSNDLPRVKTEFTSNQDATDLFNLSSSQVWNDSFYSNPPCCKVVDEKGSQELCSQTCYTSAIMEKSSGTPATNQNNTQWPIIMAIVLILAILIAVFPYLKKRPVLSSRSCMTVL